MESHYEVIWNIDSQNDGMEKYTERKKALKRGEELAKKYAQVEVEQVWLEDEETYNQFKVIAEWVNGKRIKVINA